MKSLLFALSGLFLFLSISSTACNAQILEIEIEQQIQEAFIQEGRFFVFLNKNPNVEPRTQTWPSAGNTIFAKNLTEVNPSKTLRIADLNTWQTTSEGTFQDLDAGEYFIQVLWDQDQSESRIDAPGNLYSLKQKIRLPLDAPFKLLLSEIIQQRSVVEHPLVKEITMKSEALSTFWGEDRFLKATLLLPKNYAPDSMKAYPIRYNVSGYGGRYTRINNLVANEEFMSWWNSEDAPEVINVFLDGEGPFGDSYQLDSANNGPYGEALIYELIPYIEGQYRGSNEARTRYVDGCSTGGWVSLALQLIYPDVFGGVFSYSPDAIEFTNYQLVNVYKDQNVYTNEHGYERPVMRDTNGEPMMSMRAFLNYENVLGYSNTYVTSGGQFSAHTALYSPKGEDGLPKPMFDPISGAIDKSVLENWKKYDLKVMVENNWETLGPKLQGKIYIWAADMDNFYLNPATRVFEKALREVSGNTSDAVIEYAPMQGHCQQFSNRRVLEQIAEKLQDNIMYDSVTY